MEVIPKLKQMFHFFGPPGVFVVVSGRVCHVYVNRYAKAQCYLKYS